MFEGIACAVPTPFFKAARMPTRKQAWIPGAVMDVLMGPEEACLTAFARNDSLA